VSSKTLLQQNPPVLNWWCWPTQIDLISGCKIVVVIELGLNLLQNIHIFAFEKPDLTGAAVKK